MDQEVSVEYSLSILLDDCLDYYFGRVVIKPESSLINESKLVLDFKGDVMSVFVNRKEEKKWIKESATLTIPIDPLVDSSLEILILFYGYYSEDHFGLYRVKNCHSEKYSYFTHCEPDGMPCIFPCFADYQVLFKISLELTYPDDYIAVANSPPVTQHATTHERPWSDNQSNIAFENASKFPSMPVKGFDRCKFKRSVILQTYQFAFAVGEFAVYEKEIELESEPDFRIDLRILYSIERPLGIGMLNTLEQMIGDALDSMALYLDKKVSALGLPRQWSFLIARDMPFGGMENPGLILLDENVVKSKHEVFRHKQHFETLVVVFHEICHLWFGHHSRIWHPRDTVLKEGLAEVVAQEVLSKKRGEHERSAMTNVTDICSEVDNILRSWSSTRRKVTEGGFREQVDHITYDIGKGIVRTIQTTMTPEDFQIKTQSLLADHLTVDRFFETYQQPGSSDLLSKAGIRVLKMVDFSVAEVDDENNDMEGVQSRGEGEEISEEKGEEGLGCGNLKKGVKIEFVQAESCDGVALTEMMIQVAIVGPLKAEEKSKAEDIKEGMEDTKEGIQDTSIEKTERALGLDNIVIRIPSTNTFTLTLIPRKLEKVEAVFLDPYGKMHSASCSNAASFNYIADRLQSIENPYIRASIVRSCLISLIVGQIDIKTALNFFTATLKNEPLVLCVAEYANMLSNLIWIGNKMKSPEIDTFCKSLLPIMKEKDQEPGFFAQKDLINRSLISLLPADPSDVLDHLKLPQSMTTDDLKQMFVSRVTWNSIFSEDASKLADLRVQLNLLEDYQQRSREADSLQQIIDLVSKVVDGETRESIDHETTYLEALDYLKIDEIKNLHGVIEEIREKTGGGFRKFRSLGALENQVGILMRYVNVFDRSAD